MYMIVFFDNLMVNLELNFCACVTIVSAQKCLHIGGSTPCGIEQNLTMQYAQIVCCYILHSHYYKVMVFRFPAL